MMSLPSASGELFSSFIVLLHTTQLMSPISGLLSSLPAVLISPSPSARVRQAGGWPRNGSAGLADDVATHRGFLEMRTIVAAFAA
jgi:hypothetical protein